MTRLALLADLHFGSVADGLADALLEDLLARDIDAAVIAGDLTLRARSAEFAAARAWLDRLTCPRIVVPGNHDIPARNLWRRFRSPFDRYAATIERDEVGPLALPACFVAGLNTVSSWQPHLRWQEGRVRRRDATALARTLSEARPGSLRVVVAHHPFAPVPGMVRARPVRRAATTLDVFRAAGVDVVLSGHTHQSFVLPVTHPSGRILSVGAPTALSNRRRGEENGYWIIEVNGGSVSLDLRLRHGTGFSRSLHRSFERTESDGLVL